jgi:hypothetical protein
MHTHTHLERRIPPTFFFWGLHATSERKRKRKRKIEKERKYELRERHEERKEKDIRKGKMKDLMRNEAENARLSIKVCDQKKRKSENLNVMR